MGVAATFVLVCSNVVISALRNLIPAKVRIPCFIVVIATFVTIVDMVMAAYAPALHASLGLFIPLIVVNCIILGRAEAFASKNKILLSIADGVGMGVGFTLGLAVIGTFRELLGAGSITVWAGLPKLVIPGYQPVLLMILAPGGFIALGVLLALMNHVQNATAKRKGKTIPPPAAMDCRHCTICKFGS
jgi:electron transport complex protein RnfE